MNHLGVVFILSIMMINETMSASWFDETISELNHQLDLASMKYMEDFYERKNQADTPNDNTESDHYSVTYDDTNHKRTRRSSAIMDMVNTARKTGNREELSLRSSVPFKTLNNFYNPEDIVTVLVEESENKFEIEKPLFFAVANNQNNESIAPHVLILKYNDTEKNFTVHQVLPEYAPYEIESFSGNVGQGVHRHFLSVASYAGDTDISTGMKTHVTVYEVGPGPEFKFTEIQKIYEQNVRALKYIEIDSTTYLLIGVYTRIYSYGGTTRKEYNSPSHIRILRFEPRSNYFHFHSTLPASGVVDFECFNVGTMTYLAVANYRDDFESLDIFSYVYVYKPEIRSFALIQYLSTHGARDIEHFVLASEHYLVIANEGYGTASNITMTAPSDVFKLDNGRFELVQSLETYGTIKWKNIPVPNCKHDVLLVYADQRDNVDQVGIYSFSHDQESFSAVPFSIYHLDIVNTTFRPNPLTLGTFQTQDVETGDYNLYVIIGAKNTEEGSTIYQLSYDVFMTDSPLDAFQRHVDAELRDLNDTINEVWQILNDADNALNDAVLYTDSVPITGHKTFIQQLETKSADINSLNLTTGSILFQRENKTFRIHPDIGEDINVNNLLQNASMLNRTFNDIYEGNDQLMLTNRNQNITGQFTFQDIETTKLNVYENLNVVSEMINQVNFTEFVSDVIKANDDSIITGKKYFVSSVTMQAKLTVNGKINNISIPQELVMNNKNQNITGNKIFTNSFSVIGDLVCNKINNIDIVTDIAYTNEDTQIFGEITFSNDTYIQIATVMKDINGINLAALFNDTVYISSDQSIVGDKTFLAEVYSNENITVNNLINGLDLKQLQNDVTVASNVDIDGDMVFLSNVTVLESVEVFQAINNISVETLPQVLFRKSTNQTVYSKKTFLNPLVFENDVSVKEFVGGVDISDVVTLSTDQTVLGKKTFSQNVNIKDDVTMAENSTVNNIDISNFVQNIIRLSTNDVINDIEFEDKITVYNSSIMGKLNNESKSSYQSTYEDSLHYYGNQTVTGNIVFASDLTVGDLSSTFVNKVSFPVDFARIDRDQTFQSTKTFEDDIILDAAMVTSNLINNIDIVTFSEDVANVSSQLNISGIKTFAGDVEIGMNIYIDGQINNINLSEDLLNKDGNQEITSIKRFNYVEFSDTVTVLQDVNIQRYIDGVDVSDLALKGMKNSGNETVTGHIRFENNNYDNSVDYINGIDLSELKNDIVTLNTDQTISSMKYFENLYLQKDLVTSSTIDGIDVSELAGQTMNKNIGGNFTNQVIFKNNVKIYGDLNTGTLNNINMVNFVKNVISKSNNETLPYLQVSDVLLTDLEVDYINELKVDQDIVYTSYDQIITGYKSFDNITFENVTVNGLVNQVNLTRLVDEIVYKDTSVIIDGEKTFTESVVIGSSLTTTLINGLNLTKLDWVSTNSESQSVYGTKTFEMSSGIDEIKINNFVNGENITEFFENVVTDDKDHIIRGKVTFKSNITIDGNIKIDGNLYVENNVNNVNLTLLDTNTLKTYGNQTMIGKIINEEVTVKNLQVDGLVNNLNVVEDLVTKTTFQIIKGNKTFNSSINVGDNAQFDSINDVNINYLYADTLVKSSNVTQVVEGRNSFTGKIKMNNISTSSKVDGLYIIEGKYITLNTQQNISGTLTFTENFQSNYLMVTGSISGVDIEQLNASAVHLTGDETIIGNIEFLKSVQVKENVVITGLVNGIDISEFDLSSPLVEDGLDTLEMDLNYTFGSQCSSLTNVKTSLKASGYHYDYLAPFQQLTENFITEVKHFDHNGNNYLVTVAKEDQHDFSCTSVHILLFNKSNNKFEEYQTLQKYSVKKIELIKTAWNDTYIVILNAKNVCQIPQSSISVYKFNITSNKFDFDRQLSEHDKAGDIAVATETKVSYIYFTTNGNFTTWSITETTWNSSTIIDSPTSNSLYSFKIKNQIFVASINKPNTKASIGIVEILQFEIIANSFEFLPNAVFSADGPSFVHAFTYKTVSFFLVVNEMIYSSGDLASTFDATLDIYRTNANGQFDWFQAIPTHCANHVTSYEIGESVYIAITEFKRVVKIYIYRLELGYVLVEQFQIDGVMSTSIFTVDGKYYFTAVSSKTKDSYSNTAIYQIKNQGVNPIKIKEITNC